MPGLRTAQDFREAPTRTIAAAGAQFAYRELGPRDCGGHRTCAHRPRRQRPEVPPQNATALARHLPTATVTVFPDSGHGVAFQNHRAFVDAARDFPRR